MFHSIYKTNWRIWLALSAGIFLFCFWGIDYVFRLLIGQLRLADVFSFAFIGPVFLAGVLGWLAQCALVIALSWKRNKKDKP